MIVEDSFLFKFNSKVKVHGFVAHQWWSTTPCTDGSRRPTNLGVPEFTLHIDDITTQVPVTHSFLCLWSKAFDNVDHQVLLAKLKRYGIQGRALSWIKAFVLDRKQTVVVITVATDAFNIIYLWHRCHSIIKVVSSVKFLSGQIYIVFIYIY